MQSFFIKKHDETKARRHESFYTEPHAKEILNTEILQVARLRDSLSSKFQVAIVTTTTSSSSVVSAVVEDLYERQEEVTRSLEKWDANQWTQSYYTVAENFYSLRLTSHVSSGQSLCYRENSVAELITNLQTSHELPFRDRLATRLEHLVNISEDEFPEQQPMSARSLKDLLIFIKSVPNISHPNLVLTYEGNVRAEWTKARNKHFAIEFLGNNDVRFVVFSPDPKEPRKTARASVLSTLTSIMEIAHPYGVLTWITSPNQKAA